MNILIQLEKAGKKVDRSAQGFFESRKVEIAVCIAAVIVVLLLSSRFIFKF